MSMGYFCPPYNAMKFMTKKPLTGLMALLSVSFTWAQFGGLEGDSDYLEELRTITTAVPIIAVSPDARAGGMGDVGAASEPDINGVYWNVAKLSFMEQDQALSMSYTPWMNELVSDINLAHVNYGFRIDDRQGMAIAMRYFSLGEIVFKDENNNNQGTGRPYEFTLNTGYSIKLSEQFSAGIGLRFIFSDLTNGLQAVGVETTPGNTVAGDLGLYYESKEDRLRSGQVQSYALGLAISNLGGKVQYANSQTTADFLPANIRLGGAYKLQFDQYNRMEVIAEANKLLVPTPPERDAQGNIIAGKDDNVSSFAGAIQSFSDAPGGVSEELEEVILNTGLEYWYDDRFAFRAGYQYEDPQKGGREYITIGAGIRYNVFGLDFAYLFSASPIRRSPLENTLRFTLFFNFQNNS